MTAPTRFAAALQALQQTLTRHGASYAILGGLAVVAHGFRRLTLDIDLTIWAAAIDPERLFEALQAAGFEPRMNGALEFARRSHVLLLRHSASTVSVDLSLAWLPFEREAIERAQLQELGGASVPVITVDDLIVYKAIAWRAQDRRDIAELATLHRQRLDRGRIRRWVRDVSSVLEVPERPSEVDRILDAADAPA